MERQRGAEAREENRVAFTRRRVWDSLRTTGTSVNRAAVERGVAPSPQLIRV